MGLFSKKKNTEQPAPGAVKQEAAKAAATVRTEASAAASRVKMDTAEAAAKVKADAAKVTGIERAQGTAPAAKPQAAPAPAPKAAAQPAPQAPAAQATQAAAAAPAAPQQAATDNHKKEVGKMLFQTTPAHEELRAKVRAFAEKEIAPIAAVLDQKNEFPDEQVKKIGQNGWMGLPYPKEFGGAGLDVLSYAIAVEELARVDGGAGVILSAHVSLGSYPIAAFGTDEQKKKYLTPLAKGEKIGPSV